jgi:hypothetical protein
VKHASEKLFHMMKAEPTETFRIIIKEVDPEASVTRSTLLLLFASYILCYTVLSQKFQTFCFFDLKSECLRYSQNNFR